MTQYSLIFKGNCIRHIHPLMFDVIDDKPEGEPEGFIMYKHEGFYTFTSIISGFMCYKSEGNFANGFFILIYCSLCLSPHFTSNSILSFSLNLSYYEYVNILLITHSLKCYVIYPKAHTLQVQGARNVFIQDYPSGVKKLCSEVWLYYITRFLVFSFVLTKIGWEFNHYCIFFTFERITIKWETMLLSHNIYDKQ